MAMFDDDSLVTFVVKTTLLVFTFTNLVVFLLNLQSVHAKLISNRMMSLKYEMAQNITSCFLIVYQFLFFPTVRPTSLTLCTASLIVSELVSITLWFLYYYYYYYCYVSFSLYLTFCTCRLSFRLST